ncbi:protein kinase [Kitasatospora sp. NPDC087315]|uniref:serine/threonine-protein kinase n=1 Tax=Kitasatospora sp. NPDC087315 TaxID=3364069 RepID=UPI00380AFACB
MTQAQGSTGRLLAGRYRLDAVLGRGGMGTVWRAEDEMLGRIVAVKELRMNASVEEDEKHRLIVRTLREAKATARIRHSSAVTVFDVVDEDDRPWIVMELVESRSLADVIKEDGPLEPVRAAEIALDVLGVLSAAHALGILHRDVKPSNVLIGEDGRVVLTDFGIASVEGDASVTSTGMLVGAPSYISPERARGQKPGPPADLWSLGGTLYAMVEGRPPYDRGSALATLTAVMTEELTTPTNAGPLLPVIEGLLAKDPVERLDASQTRSMLKRVVAEDTARAESTTEHAMPVRAAGVAGAAGVTGAAGQGASGSGEDAGDVKGAGEDGKDAGSGEDTENTENAGGATGKRPVGGLLGTVRVGSRAKDEEPVAAAEAAAGPEPVQPVSGEWTLGATQAAGADPRKGRRRLAVVAVVLVLLLIAGAVALVRAFGGSDNGAAQGSGVTVGLSTGADAPPVDTPPADTPPAGTEPASGAPEATTPAAPSTAPTTPSAVTTPAEQTVAPPAPAPSSAPPTPPAPAGAAVPAGYHAYKDPSGFSIVLPDWLESAGSDSVRHIFKGGGSTLTVEWTTSPGPDALADWKESEPGLRGRVTNYQRVALQAVNYREWTNAADWEWTSGSPRTHSLNRGFVTGTPAKYGYAIYWTTPDTDWNAPQNVQARETAFATFQPAP